MKKTDNFLDKIFKNPDIKFGIKSFEQKDLDKLLLKEEDGKVQIKDLKSGKFKVAKPEEIIRQLFLIKLVDDLHYSLNQIELEVPIKMGSTYASKKADIVVYREATRQNFHIIIEVKKPERKDGMEQLRSCMNATGVYWGAWSNGNQVVFVLRSDPNNYEEVRKLPAINEDVDDVKTPIKKSELRQVDDLKAIIQDLENNVLANAGVNAFEEIFKLIFTKIHDEINTPGEEVRFRTTTATPDEQYQRLNGLFREAVESIPDIFSSSDKIELSPQALIAVVSSFQKYRFYDPDLHELDIIDAGFEYMVNPEQKGEKGQYFTPRQVISMCVEMLNPKASELTIDPAAGSGRFMVYTLNWVGNELKKRWGNQWEAKRKDYASTKLYTIDFDPRLVKVAKALMLIVGDGRTNVYRANSLDKREWKDNPVRFAVQDEKYEVLMTNPPFAGKISQAEVLGQYDLAFKGEPEKHRRAKTLTRDILFIERCLQLLKSGGRMAIVLPQGDLNNTNTSYLRKWVMDKARILAVVGLGVNTFKPFTGTKTSVLFLQKWVNEDEQLKNYPIFMATSEKSGKDAGGDYVFKKNGDGSYSLDDNGRKIIDSDLPEIAQAFNKFAKEQRLNFWL